MFVKKIIIKRELSKLSDKDIQVLYSKLLIKILNINKLNYNYKKDVILLNRCLRKELTKREKNKY